VGKDLHSYIELHGACQSSRNRCFPALLLASRRAPVASFKIGSEKRGATVLAAPLECLLLASGLSRIFPLPRPHSMAQAEERSGVCQPLIEWLMRSRRLTRDDNLSPSRGCTRAEGFPLTAGHRSSCLAKRERADAVRSD
jgi:hypothetical protein